LVPDTQVSGAPIFLAVLESGVNEDALWPSIIGFKAQSLHRFSSHASHALSLRTYLLLQLARATYPVRTADWGRPAISGVRMLFYTISLLKAPAKVFQ
jgi:hypothetical protein